MESNRQKKIAGILQNDLAEILQNSIKNSGQKGILISVTKVNVTVDLSNAKVLLSVFPSTFASAIVAEVNQVKNFIKHQVALKTKNQLRRMPDLYFYRDDTLDYIEKIDHAIKTKENPIIASDAKQKRKKGDH